MNNTEIMSKTHYDKSFSNNEMQSRRPDATAITYTPGQSH